MQKTQVQSLGWEDPLEKGMAIHSSILTWRIPWTEKPGGLHSPWASKKSDTIEQLNWTELNESNEIYETVCQTLNEWFWKFLLDFVSLILRVYL